MISHYSAAIFSASLLSINCMAQKMPKHPNVILVLTDDQGHADMSSQGHPYIRTPNMDRLARESTCFSNFFVSPVSSTTRCGLLTGRYTYRTGVHDTYQSRVNMHPDEVTIAEYLKDKGYATGLFGKWHLGYNYPMRPIDQGFDEYLGWEESQYSRLTPLLEHNDQFEYRDGDLSDILLDETLVFLEKNKKKPFFCYFPLFLPHTHPVNYQVASEYYLDYSETVPRSTAEQFGMVEKADELLGKLLKRLKELKLDENTIVIFMSDNGPTRKMMADGTVAYNGKLRGFKTQVYDGGIKSPLMIRYPDQRFANQKVNRMVNYTDILPSILDMCNATPAHYTKPIDGISIVPLIKNPNTNQWIEQQFFMHFVRQGAQNIINNRYLNSCVRGEEYKLVNGNELYNIATDQGETKNIAAQYPEKVAKLHKAYDKWFDEVVAERNLKGSPNYIGSPKQRTINLYPFEKEQEVRPFGWPVKILNKGPYTIVIEQIQHEMLAPDAHVVIRVGDKTYRQKVDFSRLDAVFEQVELPLGDYQFQVDIEGIVKPKKWRYNLDDFGHRLVRVIARK